MCAIDLEPCAVWRETPRRARKAHACDCCGGRIRAGSRYVAHFSIFDRRPTAEKCCMPCMRMRDEFRHEHTQVGTPGSMRPLLDECIVAGAYDRDPVARRWRQRLRQMDARAARAAGAP